jgi:hypothetical protein
MLTKGHSVASRNTFPFYELASEGRPDDMNIENRQENSNFDAIFTGGNLYHSAVRW